MASHGYVAKEQIHVIPGLPCIILDKKRLGCSYCFRCLLFWSIFGVCDHLTRIARGHSIVHSGHHSSAMGKWSAIICRMRDDNYSLVRPLLPVILQWRKPCQKCKNTRLTFSHESSFLYHIFRLLMTPQGVKNNDGCLENGRLDRCGLTTGEKGDRN